MTRSEPTFSAIIRVHALVLVPLLLLVARLGYALTVLILLFLPVSVLIHAAWRLAAAAMLVHLSGERGVHRGATLSAGAAYAAGALFILVLLPAAMIATLGPLVARYPWLILIPLGHGACFLVNVIRGVRKHVNSGRTGEPS